MTIEVRELPTYDGVTTVGEFLEKFESTVPKQQRVDVLKWELHATLKRWWGTHQGKFED